jgi:hypothetical protein
MSMLSLGFNKSSESPLCMLDRLMYSLLHGSPVLRILIRDPVIFDSWIRDADPGWKKNPDPVSEIQDHISESFVQVFGLNILKLFVKLNSVLQIRIRDPVSFIPLDSG